MNPSEQILFHSACLLRRPAHWRWHFAGIRRALALAAENIPARA